MSLFHVSIRDSDRALALKVRTSGWLWRPGQLSEFTYDLWQQEVDMDAERLGVRFLDGALAGSLGERATTWGKRLVTLPAGFSSRDRTRRLPTLTHELRHCHEYPAHTLFRLRYLTDVRFRWAIECQGVAAELRCMRALDARKANMLARAERAADAFAQPFPGYSMGRIRELRAETIDLLTEVFA